MINSNLFFIMFMLAAGSVAWVIEFIKSRREVRHERNR